MVGEFASADPLGEHELTKLDNDRAVSDFIDINSQVTVQQFKEGIDQTRKRDSNEVGRRAQTTVDGVVGAAEIALDVYFVAEVGLSALESVGAGVFGFGASAEKEAAEAEAKALAEAETEAAAASQSEVGTYTTKIKWGIQEVEARPAGPGFWGKRTPQTNPAVDAFEMKINPNNESYYLSHPQGGFVQFENLAGTTLQDGKLVTNASSIYKVSDLPAFAQQSVLKEATRQVEAASAHGLQVEWLVSDSEAASQLVTLFEKEGVNIKVTYFP